METLVLLETLEVLGLKGTQVPQVLQGPSVTLVVLGLTVTRAQRALRAQLEILALQDHWGTLGLQDLMETLVLQGPQVLTVLQEILGRLVLLEHQERQDQRGLLVQSVVALPWIWMTHTRIMSLEGNFMPSIATTLQPRTSLAP